MNYIGSKFSLLDFLRASISAATAYKAGGCKVIANDIQYYSYILNKHYIENVPPIDTALLEYLNNLPGIEGFIFNNYCEGSGSGRNYFTDINGKKCDAVRTELEKLHQNGEIDNAVYYYFLASLINSIDKYANTASVYGAFLKHIKKSAQKEFKLDLLPIIDGPTGEVYNEDVNKLIRNISGDVLYLDPPYNARQYCTNYHVLETIARYDNPVLIGKTGLRDYQDQKSAFCSKRTVAKVFEDLIINAKFKYIFLSYNNEGLMSLDTIKEIMSKYGSYSCYTQDYKRFKADKDMNRNISAAQTTEYLHCLIK